LKTKYQESLLDNKRLQDRIDSLEFYSRNSLNSSAFHQLTLPSTTGSSTPTNSGSGSSTRARTPAPIVPRSNRLPSSSHLTSSAMSGGGGSSSASGGGGGYSTISGIIPSSVYDKFEAKYEASLRASPSRHSSVERLLSAYVTTPLESSSSSTYGGGGRDSDYNSSLRSRNSSPVRSYADSSYYSRPPINPSYDSSSSYRSRREPSVEFNYVPPRNRRENSLERYSGAGSGTSRSSGIGSSSSSSSGIFNKGRRSSYTNSIPPLPKYY
jgi:hypothetical protein